MPSRRQLYHLAFEPVYDDTGTPYPCNSRHLASYRRLPGPNRQNKVCALEAVAEIVDLNSEYRRREDYDRSEWAAMSRLTYGVTQANARGWGPDLIIKMFADLDLVFFNGRLLGNVRIRWQDLSNGVLGDTTLFPPHQAGIRLNAKSIFLLPNNDSMLEVMFSTMLHEMCHAYRFIRCSSREQELGRDGHDAPFRAMIHAVHRRAYDCLGLYAISRTEGYMYDHEMSDDWADERGGGPRGPRDDGDPLLAPFRGDDRIPSGGRHGTFGIHGGGDLSPLSGPRSLGAIPGGPSPFNEFFPLDVLSPFGGSTQFGGSVRGGYGGIPYGGYGGIRSYGVSGDGHDLPPGCW